MLNLTSVIDFSLSEIKNKTIISDDSRLEVVMISEIKPNIYIYSQRSVLNLNIDLFLLETNCLVDQEKIQSIDRTYSVQQKTTGNQCFKTLNSKQANRINV